MTEWSRIISGSVWYSSGSQTMWSRNGWARCCSMSQFWMGFWKHIRSNRISHKISNWWIWRWTSYLCWRIRRLAIHFTSHWRNFSILKNKRSPTFTWSSSVFLKVTIEPTSIHFSARRLNFRPTPCASHYSTSAFYSSFSWSILMNSQRANTESQF